MFQNLKEEGPLSQRSQEQKEKLQHERLHHAKHPNVKLESV